MGCCFHFCLFTGFLITGGSYFANVPYFRDWIATEMIEFYELQGLEVPYHHVSDPYDETKIDWTIWGSILNKTEQNWGSILFCPPTPTPSLVSINLLWPPGQVNCQLNFTKSYIVTCYIIKQHIICNWGSKKNIGGGGGQNRSSTETCICFWNFSFAPQLCIIIYNL